MWTCRNTAVSVVTAALIVLMAVVCAIYGR